MCCANFGCAVDSNGILIFGVVSLCLVLVFAFLAFSVRFFLFRGCCCCMAERDDQQANGGGMVQLNNAITAR
ncbi:MAG: hypothetical protein ACTJLM_01710 [Ehrlichia sp.]